MPVIINMTPHAVNYLPADGPAQVFVHPRDWCVDGVASVLTVAAEYGDVAGLPGPHPGRC